jgi:hypothetical protein
LALSAVAATQQAADHAAEEAAPLGGTEETGEDAVAAGHGAKQATELC